MAINKIRIVFGLLVVSLILTLPCFGEEQKMPNKQNYERLKHKEFGVLMNTLLERTLYDCSKAQEEINAIVSDPKTKITKNADGFWVVLEEKGNQLINIDFWSQNGPLQTASKNFYWNKITWKQIPGSPGYDIEYDEKGNIITFGRRPPGEILDFYPNGKLKLFFVRLSEKQSFSAEWDAEGKLIREGTRITGPLPSQFEGEINDYQKVADSHPNTPEAVDSLRKIAEIYEKEEREYEKAIEYYKRAIENSTNEDVIAEMKWFISQDYLNQKEYSKAIEVLQEIIEKYPKSSYVAQSKLLIADCYEKMEDYAKAISQYEEIAKNYPKEEQKQSALSKIGMLYTAMRDYKNAVESYEKIITKYPGTLVAKVAKYQIRVIKEYYEKGLEPSVEELQKISKEEGF